MLRGVINCAKLFLSHQFGRIKSFDQWAVDRDPVLTSTTSAKNGETAIKVRNECTAILAKTSHANCCTTLTNRPLRPREGRFVRVV